MELREKFDEGFKLNSRVNQLETELNIQKNDAKKLGRQNIQSEKYLKDLERTIKNLNIQLEQKERTNIDAKQRLQRQKDFFFEKGEQILELERKLNEEQLKQYQVSPQELREFNGIKGKFNQVQKAIGKMSEKDDETQHIKGAIDALNEQAGEWTQKRDETESPMLKENFDMFRERTEFEADRIRTKILKTKPVHTQTEDAIKEETDNNPKVAFEKYKDFIKKNFIGISGLFIGLAGVITTIMFAIRSGVKRAGSSTQKAGNEVGKSGGLVGNILGNIMQNTGKIISWAGDHLMITIGVVLA